ncbi:MAG: DUF937 domain-containing protein [Anaerorhabdus sp.]
MDIQTILSALGDSGASQLSEKTGASSSQITDLMSSALPALMSAMQSNATSTDGAQGLAKALDDHAEADTSDITSFLKNVDLDDGAKILSKIFGSNESTVQNALAEKSGLSASQVSTSLASIAPLLLSFLGQEKKSTSSSSGTDLTSMLGSLLGGGSSSSNGLESLLKGVTGLFK